MAVLAIYLAGLCDYQHRLAAGEVGTVLLIAPDKKQAKVLLDYAEGTLKSTPILKQLILSRTAETLTLKTGITLEVRSASFRRIRGVTCVAVLADECAFWLSDESANPDVEILNAARPALATTQGPLIAISSPYARRGALWETYRKHFKPDGDPTILVAQGATRDFNPQLPQSIVDKAMDRDPAAASAEYMAQFRTDVEGFITKEAIDACVDVGVRERPHERKHAYVAFLDPSGGSSDSFTMAIAHKEGETMVLDVIRERKPPFSPEAVVAEYVELMKKYRISSAVADRYGGEWVVEQFRKLGINVEPAKKSKSEIYADFLPLVNSRGCALLDHDKMVNQLGLLERRTARGGKELNRPSPEHARRRGKCDRGRPDDCIHHAWVRGFDRKLEYPPIGIV